MIQKTVYRSSARILCALILLLLLGVATTGQQSTTVCPGPKTLSTTVYGDGVDVDKQSAVAEALAECKQNYNQVLPQLMAQCLSYCNDAGCNTEWTTRGSKGCSLTGCETHTTPFTGSILFGIGSASITTIKQYCDASGIPAVVCTCNSPPPS